MEESLELAVSLDDRVLKAKQSENELEDLLKEYMPFINAQVTRYSSPANQDKHDELQSIAMMAFCEAIKKYEADKGHFFPFVSRVVRARLIDSLRRAYRFEEQTVPLETEGDDDDSINSSMLNEVSIRLYDAQRTNELLVEEIEQFKIELASWGITMDVLAKQSPKQKKLLATYKMAVKKISQDVNIIQTIQLKRYFPIKAISKLTGLPQKNLERARTFIIASLIIKLGDFSYLSDYIK